MRSLAARWLLAAVLLALLGAQVGAAPPRLQSSEYQVRRLLVGSLEGVGGPLEGMVWDTFDFAHYTLSFTQPLYVLEPPAPAVRADGTAGPAGVPAAQTGPALRASQLGLNESMHFTVAGAFELLCSVDGREVRLPLAEDFPFDFWQAPRLGLFLPQSPKNEFRDVAGVFDLFRAADADLSSSAACGAYGHCSHNAVSFLVPLRRHLRAHPDAERAAAPADVAADYREFLPESALAGCSVRYVPAQARSPPASAPSSPASPPSPRSRSAVFANRGGQEVAVGAVVPRAAEPAFMERSVLRLQADPRTRQRSWERTRGALREGDLQGAGKAIEGASNSVDVAALLETETRVQGMVGLIMDPVCGGFVKSLLDLLVNLMMDAFADQFTKKMYEAINTEVAPDVTIMLGVTLRANISNILTDAVSFSVGTSLADGLIQALRPRVVDKLTADLPRHITTMLDRTLREKIPMFVDEHAPKVIARALAVTLSQGLTRSITHSLVPTLTHALPHTSNADYYCYVCATQNDACHLCHFSALSVYYQVYYGNYYTAAIRAVDAELVKKVKYPGQELLEQSSKYLERAGIKADE